MGEDQHIRAAAFDHVRRLSDTHDPLTSNELKPGFMFQGEHSCFFGDRVAVNDRSVCPVI